MKIRKGFVSNSSSSSFLVIFPSEPKDKYDVLRMMNGEVKESYIIKTFESYSDIEVAETVWKDIKKQGSNNILKAVAEITDDQYDYYYDDDKNILEYCPTWKENFEGYKTIEELEQDIILNDNQDYQLSLFKDAIEEVKSFMDSNPGVLYSFTFEGRCKVIFYKLPNKVYSHP